MAVTISRLYDRYADAERAVTALETAGIPHSDISIVANNSDDWYNSGKKDRDSDGVDDRAESAGKGAGIGAGLGGAAGLLAGLGLLAMRRPRFAVLLRRSQAGEEPGNVRCFLRRRLGAYAVGCKIAQRLLSQSDLLQRPHRVQAFELRLQFFFDSRLDAAVFQKPIAWRRRREVDLVNARTIARLRLQLERGLEEVDVQA